MANSMAIGLAVFLFLALLKCCLVSAMNVSYDGRGFILDGKRRIILSGSIHYPRSTPEMWPDLVKKAKEGGLNTIETYVFWNAHEPLYRQYDFTGNKDLVRFIKTIQAEGLHAVLRIGPYICGEWNYGGFPVWLHNIPGIRLRTKNDIYQNEMKTFTTLIVDKLRSENLFAPQGGPIIIAQIENEYGNIESSYGNDGKEYINWCANLALSYHVGVPWIMCQQGDAPRTMINTCNGYYCDQFWPNDASNKPKGWTENWVGWFKNWGMQDPHRTAEDVAFAVARFFQLGGSFQNYYMYHGGTNFNRSAGGPYIATTYDYDAPLDEYGNLNQPKWGHLKRLHEVIMSIEEILTYGEKRDIDYGSLVSGTIYSYEGKQSCFLGNANTHDATVDLLGTKFVIPAWSVTVLPDCYSEVYNTAKVSSQTSIMVKEPNKGEDQSEPYVLEWKWRPEHFEVLQDGIVHGSAFTANELLDQKAVTNDTTDYLWYLTSVDIQAGDPIAKATRVTLHVRTEGHVIHVIFNGKHLDKKYGYGMNLEVPVKLEVGTNTISLLSATVGLQNYGGNFDLSWVGIHGPVTLMGRDSYGDVVIKNLTSNPWTYKVGIHGMEKGIFRPESRHQSGWHALNLPSNRELVWYKTTFKSPIGTDPVVVDLMGLGKGTAWVNGNNLGRYWPAYLASTDGCTSTCDYRGSYYANKCMTNCGQPSQRYYHVPRDWLQDDDNELVLFEEFGGTPMNVQFYTVTVGSICATPYEGQKLELSCQGGRVISEIRFASFGLPTGICGKFEKGVCEAKNTMQTIEKECLGKDRCTLDVSEDTFGPTGCKKTNQLMVEAVCSVGY